jgi:hypothetical protein
MGKRRWTDKQEDDLYTMRMEFEKLNWRDFMQLYEQQGRGLPRTAKALCKRFNRVAENRRCRRVPQGKEMAPQIAASSPDSFGTAESEWSLLRESWLPNPEAESAAKAAAEQTKTGSCDFLTAADKPQDHWWRDATGSQMLGHRIFQHYPERFGRIHDPDQCPEFHFRRCSERISWHTSSATHSTQQS